MKFLKNILPITLFIIGTLCAKITRQPGQAQPTPPAEKRPVAPVQIQPSSSYKIEHDKLFYKKQSDVFNMQTGELQPSFIAQIQNAMRDGEPRDITGLLKTARDIFMPLTGNDDIDLARLQAVNKQIVNASGQAHFYS